MPQGRSGSSDSTKTHYPIISCETTPEKRRNKNGNVGIKFSQNKKFKDGQTKRGSPRSFLKQDNHNHRMLI